MIYGETEKELNENFAIIKRFSELFEPQLKNDQIKKILALLNNTGGVMLSDEKENSH